ncbi:hypothetical protein M976_02721 [Buttiauxella ferragutiae ATCC 51602]|uniref:Phage protein n=1 Tax=Buttiauxella ferragutiae ATCC 51602 TaxID=1354252 RepID=A0ABX2W6N9_9ENTR|nr:hypothetical protein M976_02721 [Buttiauxella ferragutiae ATCC 51602]
MDVLYVVTGVRSTVDLSDDEQELLNLYKKAPLAVKAAAIAALNAGISASTTVNVSGQGNRAAGRDYNENKK